MISTDTIDYVRQEIAKIDKELFNLQHEIWKHPELKFEEVFAHDSITSFMEKQEGWKVTKHAFGLDTSFVCEFSIEPESNPTVVSFNSEFDALPGIGHACGHNLIAVAGVTAALGASIAMKNFGLTGTIKLLGTPAEERGGGKIKMIEAGAYDTVDVSIMAHPGNTPHVAYCTTSANSTNTVEFFGKETHAAANPWEGVNALDALVITYNAMSVLRQQLRPDDIMQCCFTEAGQSANIITGYSSGQFCVRAKSKSRVEELKTLLNNCVKAGAVATGCEYKLKEIFAYDDLVPNKVMTELYRSYMNSLFDCSIPSLEVENVTGYCAASTDQGNVSYHVPAIQPMFTLDCAYGPHNKNFAASAGTREAHTSAIETALAMCFTGLELLGDSDLLENVKESWKKDMEAKKSVVS